MIPPPETTEYAPFYAGYVAKATEAAAQHNGDLIKAMQTAHRALQELLGSLSDERAQYRYAPGKWSIKDLVGHLTDAERIFCYRALRFARGDVQELPGFDENLYAEQSNAAERSIHDLLAEFAVVRAGTLALLKSFTPAMVSKTGVASKHPMSVRALAYIMAGHEIHHYNVIKERYLNT